jgi:hypothetical protein
MRNYGLNKNNFQVKPNLEIVVLNLELVFPGNMSIFIKWFL